MKRTILVFGSLIIAIAALFQISKHAFITGTSRFEIIISLIAIFFLLIGIFISRRNSKKTEINSALINKEKIKELEISDREYEVLQKVALGLSNKEIADNMFLSESTIKTHVSNLFVKLNSKRRTQAVQTAKKLKIL